ncbi:MAG: fumarylacetoacetate hydrolase family protein, partial [Sediminibacterium sp.]|nr:fumarylacetoacetate hydrolase family protein [Sediminibacterium sp.]
MKLVSYWQQGLTKLGAIVNDQVYALQDVNQQLPNDINAFLRLGVSVREETQEKLISLLEKSGAIAPVQDYQLMAPVPHPTSCRDGYAFRQHVEAARRNRGVDMIQEFDQYPIFYFTNHNAIQGPGAIYCMPDHFQQLDFELEIAIVIGKEGKNIKAKDA